MRTHNKEANIWVGLRMQAVVQGQFRVSADPDIYMSTVLGSCVSVVLFDRSAGIGGLNHFLLPKPQASGQSELKYGAMANELLINEMLKRGAVRSQMRAKLFGGAHVVASLGDIGAKNALFAKDYMNREGISVEYADTGGTMARRLHFHPATGDTKVIVVPVDQEQSVVANERPRRPSPPKTDVTLF